MNLRGENDGLTDHLALGVRWDIDGIGTGARSTTNEGGLVGGGPATMANISLADLGGISVGGGTSQHTETLNRSVRGFGSSV